MCLECALRGWGFDTQWEDAKENLRLIAVAEQDKNGKPEGLEVIREGLAEILTPIAKQKLTDSRLEKERVVTAIRHSVPRFNAPFKAMNKAVTQILEPGILGTLWQRQRPIEKLLSEVHKTILEGKNRREDTAKTFLPLQDQIEKIETIYKSRLSKYQLRNIDENSDDSAAYNIRSSLNSDSKPIEDALNKIEIAENLEKTWNTFLPSYPFQRLIRELITPYPKDNIAAQAIIEQISPRGKLKEYLDAGATKFLYGPVVYLANELASRKKLDLNKLEVFLNQLAADAETNNAQLILDLAQYIRSKQTSNTKEIPQGALDLIHEGQVKKWDIDGACDPNRKPFLYSRINKIYYHKGADGKYSFRIEPETYWHDKLLVGVAISALYVMYMPFLGLFLADYSTRKTYRQLKQQLSVLQKTFHKLR